MTPKKTGKLYVILPAIACAFLMLAALPIMNVSGTLDATVAGEPATRSLADSPWPMFRNNPAHTGVSPHDTSDNPGVMSWKFMTGNNIRSSPAIGPDGTLYFGSTDKNLYAVNPDGTLKWSYLAGDWISSSPAIADDGTIYFGSADEYLYALNSGGTLKWRYETDGRIGYSSPVIDDDGTIYIGSYDGFLHAVNPSGTGKWVSYMLTQMESSAAIGPDGTIYIGTWGNKWENIPPSMNAVDPADGTLKWRYNLEVGDNWIISSPAIAADGTIYFGSYDGHLYALNPTGSLKWKYQADDGVHSSPAIGSDGTIYFGSNDYKFYAVNPDGSLKWNFQAGHRLRSSPVIGSDGTIFVGSIDKNLYAINPDGSLRWAFETSEIIDETSPAIGSDGTVYFGTLGQPAHLYAVNRGPPSRPTDLSALPGDGQVTLEWSEPETDGGWPITNYRIYRGATPGDTVQIHQAAGTVREYVDTDVTNGQTYHYRVSAVNSKGEGTISDPVEVTPSALPTAPRDLRITIGSGTATLRWDTPENTGGFPVTGYKVYRGTAPDALTEITQLGTVTTYSDSGLVNGQTYHYAVTAITSAGEGPKSDAVPATPVGSPMAPRSLTATADDGSVTLEWDPPEEDGGSPVIEYNIYRGTSPGAEVMLESVDGDETSYQDDSVTNGVTYFYYINALNSVGLSPPSNDASATPVGLPGAPVSVAVGFNSGDMMADLVWQPPLFNGGSAVVSYKIYRGVAADSMSLVATIPAETQSYRDDDVSLGSTYHYGVSAVNSLGEGARSDAVSVTPVTVPSAPSGLSVLLMEGGPTLSWNAPDSNGGAAITEYIIYRGNRADSMTQIANVSGEVTTYTDAGAAPGGTYHYGVSAVNQAGEGDHSESVRLDYIQAPSEPREVTVNVADGEVKLTWSVPASDGGSAITGYRIYRGLQGSEMALLRTVEGAVTSYTDDGVDEGKTYIYGISAVNTVGEGPLGQEVSAEIPERDKKDGDTTPGFGLPLAILAAISVLALLSLDPRGRRRREI